MLKKRNIPTIIYVNKMDKDGIKFESLLEDIKLHFGSSAIPFCYPMGHDNNFDGFINVVELKARKYNGKHVMMQKFILISVRLFLNSIIKWLRL